MAEVLEVVGGAVLKLDSFKNKWNNPLDEGFVVDDMREIEAEDRCPNSHLYARFIVEDGSGKSSIKFVYLRCKLWSCPYCARVNAQNLYMKVQRGIAGCLEAEQRDGFRSEYSVKFLTLTLPGREWRDQNSRKDAESIIKYSFKKLIYQLRRKKGHIEYIWVMEFQRDGYAHLHVILIGRAIAGKEVKDQIEKLWREQQGLGFIRFNAVEGGTKHLAHYLSKYITQELANGNKGSHVYGASSGFYTAIKKGKPQITMIERGKFAFADGQYVFTPLWQIHDDVTVEQFRVNQVIEAEEADDLWFQMLLPWGEPPNPN